MNNYNTNPRNLKYQSRAVYSTGTPILPQYSFVEPHYNKGLRIVALLTASLFCGLFTWGMYALVILSH